jgi:hypothetical protein
LGVESLKGAEGVGNCVCSGDDVDEEGYELLEVRVRATNNDVVAARGHTLCNGHEEGQHRAAVNVRHLVVEEGVSRKECRGRSVEEGVSWAWARVCLTAEKVGSVEIVGSL